MDLNLHRGEIHVWQADFAKLGNVAPAAWKIMSADEQRRAQRFCFLQDRHRFCASRLFLRSIIASYTRGKAGDLIFVVGPFGKPRLSLSNTVDGFEFNLAHSRCGVLLAVTRGRCIGIDVEDLRPIPEALKIARQYFSAAERYALERIPEDEQQVAFLTCWTRKEAVVKAMGGGLHIPLDAFSVPLSTQQPLRVSWLKNGSSRPPAFNLVDLSAGSAVIALAVEGSVGCVKRRRFEDIVNPSTDKQPH